MTKQDFLKESSGADGSASLASESNVAACGVSQTDSSSGNQVLGKDNASGSEFRDVSEVEATFAPFDLGGEDERSSAELSETLNNGAFVGLADGVGVESAGSAPAFFEGKPYSPAYTHKREQPAHRYICSLLAQGFTPGEVAEQTGFARATITSVKAQPWAKAFIADLQQKGGEVAVKSVLMSAASEAAQTLVKMMNGEIECRPTDRKDAAKTILDRCFGTAPQHIKHEKVDASDLTIEELERIAAGRNN